MPICTSSIKVASPKDSICLVCSFEACTRDTLAIDEVGEGDTGVGVINGKICVSFAITSVSAATSTRREHVNDQGRTLDKEISRRTIVKYLVHQ